MLDGGEPLVFEESMTAADGTVHWVIKSKRVVDTPGTGKLVLVTVQPFASTTVSGTVPNVRPVRVVPSAPLVT